MKCKFLVDIDVDVDAMDAEQMAKVDYRPGISHITGQPQPEAYFPAGTEYDHPKAYHFCDIGCAVPADAECEAAAKPISPEARRKLELNYQADALGIHEPADRKLFFAGVIAGYEGLGPGKLAYLPGPNWAKWKAAQDAGKAKAAAQDI